MKGDLRQRGALCISIDLELAWGYWDTITNQTIKECVSLERPIISRILALFRRHDVQATWAIVSALIDPKAPRQAGDMAAWYAPDVISEIVNSAPKQEIGSHSYAHVYYGKALRAAVADDLACAKALHSQHSLPFDSFVFPQNLIGQVDLLAASGIKVFRGLDRGMPYLPGQIGRRLGRVANFVDKLLPIEPPAVQPIIQPANIVELPGSTFMMGRNGIRRFIHPGLFEIKCKRGIDAAVESTDARVFHLWFHPSNFYHQPEVQFAILNNILAHAAQYRDRAQLSILPMGEFANV